MSLVFYLPGILLLFWANLIFTSNLLSLFNLLGNKILYFLVSISLNGLLWFLTLKVDSYYENSRLIANYKFFKLDFLSKFLWIYLCFVAFFMMWMMYFYLPIIPDSFSMKLPKIHFYLQQGNLLPNLKIADERMFVAPLDATILEMFLYNYQVNLHYYLILGFFAWIGIGISLYSFSRLLGAGRVGSFIAMWFFILTQQLIFQGSTENDDILNGFAIAVSLFYGLVWLKNQSRFAAILLGLGVGISIGIKPIIIFTVPAIILYHIFSIFQNGFTYLYYWYKKEITNVLVILVAIFLTASNSYLANYKVTGSLSQSSGYIVSVVNKPFNLTCGLQNLFVHTFTLFSNPIFNIENTNNKTFHEQYKKNVKPFFKFTESNEKCLYHSLSNYGDILISDPYIHESTAAFDFFPILALISLFFVLISNIENKKMILWLNLGFMCSFILYCVTTKYIGPIFRYWIPIFLFIVPNIAFGWDSLKPAFKVRKTILVSFIILNMFFSLLFFWKGLNLNNQRNLGTMLFSEKLEVVNYFSLEFQNLIRGLKKYNLVFYNTFNYLYLFYINPNAIITILNEPVEDYPNIVYFLYNYREFSLNTNNFFPKYIPVEIPELFNLEDAYYDFGLMYGHKAFVNNIPIQKNKKKFFLFKWIWVDMAQRKGYLLPFNSLKKNPNLEFKFIVYEAPKTEKIIKGWSGEISKELIIPKDSITFEILIREKNTPNKIFYGKWPVNEWHDIGIN